MTSAPIDSEATESGLREPANQVSPRALSYWRVGSLVGLVVLAILTAAWWFLLPHPWWAFLIVAVLVGWDLVDLLIVPKLRYRIHRWEVTPTAVFTRSGWLMREQRIAPLNRVQTVDSHQGPLMRMFNLSSITVTTASAAGPITIDCLDHDLAQRLVAELTARTAAVEGDAT